MTTTRTGTPLLIWHGFCSFVELSDHDKTQLQRLLNGELATLDYEKLNGVKVYSIRSSDARRILFTTRNVQDKAYIFVLEILPTHDYRNAHSLKRGVVEKFFDNHDAAIQTAILDGTIAIEPNAALPTFTKPTHPEYGFEVLQMDFFNQQFLLLNDEQNQTKKLALPAVVTGPAGSGKTTVALSYLLDIVRDIHERGETIELPIVVVSDKPHLRDETRSQWINANNPLANTPAGQQVLFLTDEEVVALYSDVQTRELVALPPETLTEDIAAHVEKQMATYPTFPLAALKPTLVHEFELIAACTSEQAYLDLGERQSNLIDNHRVHREFLWKAARSYFKDLIKANKYVYRFHQWKVEAPCFHMVIADEAHASSLVCKLMQRRMVEAGRYLAFVHSAQTTDKAISHVPLLIQRLGTDKHPVTEHSLTISYRNPLRVVQLANTISRLKRFVAGGITDKTEEIEMIAHETNAAREGRIEWVWTNQVGDFVNRVNTSHRNIAIITPVQHIEEARTKFNTGMVFTPNDIGGLEFDEVIMYRLMDIPQVNQLNNKLKNYQPQGKDKVHLPKASASQTEFQQFFSWLYTAATRTKTALYVIEPKPKNRHYLQEHLINAIKSAKGQEQTSINAPKKIETTVAEWQAEINRLLAQNLTDVAKRIWMTNLKRDEASFLALITLRQNQTSILKPFTTPTTHPKKAVPLKAPVRMPSAPHVEPPIQTSKNLEQLTCDEILSLGITDTKKLYALYREKSYYITRHFWNVDFNETIVIHGEPAPRFNNLIYFSLQAPGLLTLIISTLGDAFYTYASPLQLNTIKSKTMLYYMAKEEPLALIALTKHCPAAIFKSVEPPFWTQEIDHVDSILTNLLCQINGKTLFKIMNFIQRDEYWILQHTPFEFWLRTPIQRGRDDDKVSAFDKPMILELFLHKDSPITLIIDTLLSKYSKESINKAFKDNPVTLRRLAIKYADKNALIEVIQKYLTDANLTSFMANVAQAQSEVKTQTPVVITSQKKPAPNPVYTKLREQFTQSLESKYAVALWSRRQPNGKTLFIDALEDPDKRIALLSTSNTLLSARNSQSLFYRFIETFLDIYVETDPTNTLMISTEKGDQPFLFWLFDDLIRRDVFDILYHEDKKRFLKHVNFDIFIKPIYSVLHDSAVPLLASITHGVYIDLAHSLLFEVPALHKKLFPMITQSYKMQNLDDYCPLKEWLLQDLISAERMYTFMSLYNNHLIKSIPLDFWLEPSYTPKNQTTPQSLFQLLFTANGGLKLVNVLLNHWMTCHRDTLFDTLSDNFLFSPIYDSDGEPSLTPLIALSLELDYIELFEILLLHANYPDDALASALTSILPALRDNEALAALHDRSIFSLIVNQPPLFEILFKVFKQRPSVFDSLVKHEGIWDDRNTTYRTKKDVLLYRIYKSNINKEFFLHYAVIYPDLLKRAMKFNEDHVKPLLHTNTNNPARLFSSPGHHALTDGDASPRPSSTK